MYIFHLIFVIEKSIYNRLQRLVKYIRRNTDWKKDIHSGIFERAFTGQISIKVDYAAKDMHMYVDIKHIVRNCKKSYLIKYKFYRTDNKMFIFANIIHRIVIA